MDRRRAVQVGAVLWAAVGAAIALASLDGVNADARPIVGVASILGPLAAVLASRSVARAADRVAGGLLLMSVLTPTYFAYVLNLPALVIGIALLAVPQVVLPRRRDATALQEHAWTHEASPEGSELASGRHDTSSGQSGDP